MMSKWARAIAARVLAPICTAVEGSLHPRGQTLESECPDMGRILSVPMESINWFLFMGPACPGIKGIDWCGL
jgi:hypothetical protein